MSISNKNDLCLHIFFFFCPNIDLRARFLSKRRHLSVNTRALSRPKPPRPNLPESEAMDGEEQYPLLGSNESIQDELPPHRRLSPILLFLLVVLVLDWIAAGTLSLFSVYTWDNDERTDSYSRAYLSAWLVVGSIGLGVISNFLLSCTRRSCEDPNCQCFDFPCCVASYFVSVALLTFFAIALPVVPGVLLSLNAVQDERIWFSAFGAGTAFFMSLLCFLIVCLTFKRVHQSD